MIGESSSLRHALMAVLPAAEHPAPPTISQLPHEFALNNDLDGCSARPVVPRLRCLIISSCLGDLFGDGHAACSYAEWLGIGQLSRNLCL